jgi:hypothetical protein
MPPRPRYPMPDYIREALESLGVIGAYHARLSRALCGVRPTNKMTTSAVLHAQSVSRRKKSV